MTRLLAWYLLGFQLMLLLGNSGDSGGGNHTAGSVGIAAAQEEDEGGQLPPLLDSDDIAYFFERNDLDGLYWALSTVFDRSERNPDPNLDPKQQRQQQEHQFPLPQQLVARGGGPSYTTAYKLKMDLEQAEFLASSNSSLFRTNLTLASYFQTTVIPIYKEVLSRIPPLDQMERTQGLYAFRTADYDAGIANVYNKALHLTASSDDKHSCDNTIDSLDDAIDMNALLNPQLDTGKIEKEWFGDGKGIVVVDDVLSPQALKRIRQILLESTVWYQTKMPLKFGGYAGAYIDDGLHDRILLQLSMELHKALPRIMEGHPLKYLWAYKYDADFTGINLHADEAAVNVNLWVTPDDANLDPDSGGLVVFTAKPPPDWNFEEYNTNTERVIEELLRPTNFENITIPHRQNRAVLFDSALFHHSDKYKFRPGYENRRINLTLLYGTMSKVQQGTTTTTKSEL